MLNKFFLSLKEKYTDFEFDRNLFLKNFSTIRIGGIAKYIVFPPSKDCFIELLNFLTTNNVKFKIVGNGSNILFSDKGFDGVIIITKKLNSFKQNGNTICAECGVSLSRLSSIAFEASLTGLEKFKMIPATVGGAIVMNAGDSSVGILDYVSSITYYYRNEIVKKSIKDCCFSYRSSEFFCSEKYILEAEFDLKYEKKCIIYNKLIEFENYRKQTQPYDKKSLGSVFKHNSNIIPAKVIDESGLKGLRIGDAVVSLKHAGFIINEGKATSENVKELVLQIKQTVFKNYGILLIEEIEYFGNE